MPENAVHQFLIEPAERAPETVALVNASTGLKTTRQDLLTGAQQAACFLANQGVVAEQRVMMCCYDSSAFLNWFWGAIWIGAVPVPVSTMLTTKDYEFLIKDSRAVGVVFSAGQEQVLAPALEEQPFLKWSQVEDLVNEDMCVVQADPFAAVAEDVAFWLYTSGTTGFPKGAMHRHKDMGFCTNAYAKGILGMTEDDVIYSVAKLFFAYGLGNSGYLPAGTGAKVVLNPGRPVPEEIADHVVTHQPTIFFGVPTSYGQLLSADISDETFASVRIAVSAGEPLPAEIHRRFLEKFGVEVLDGFGTTELAHVAISNRPGKSVPGSSGTVVDGYEVSLRDENGEEVEDGEPGLLHVKGESVMVGYWNRTDRTREALLGRYLVTGDTYVRNDDGTYSCLGRSDDMLKVGGIWVSPTEVEGCILELEQIAQVAVVGAEDEEGLTKPKAYVVLEEGVGNLDVASLVQSHVRERLAPFKYPRWVESVPELPQTATGKIKRYLLRS